MFGYVRPVKSELKVREYDAFKAAYCGLCMALKKKYGLPARFAVNYDLTFLAMLLSKSDSAPKACSGRCISSPCRKKNYYCGDGAFETAADISVILSWWKLRDSINDGKRRLISRAACLFLRGKLKKACASQPEFSANTERFLSELSSYEASEGSSLDEAADKFASILASASCAAKSENDRRVLSQLLYHLGRYIYILDALDDFPRDNADGSYNPLKYRFSKAPGEELSAAEKKEINETLALSEALIASAYELLDKGFYDEILSNTIYLGLPEVRRLVNEGKGEALQKYGSIHSN
jgi:hypothetical protein